MTILLIFQDADDFRLLGSEIQDASGHGPGGILTSVLYLTDFLAEPLVELGLLRFAFGTAAVLTSASFSRIVGENPSGSFHLTCMAEQWQRQGPSTPLGEISGYTGAPNLSLSCARWRRDKCLRA